MKSEEVLARVQVQLRHKEEKEAGREHNLSLKNMVLNRETFQVRIDGRILPEDHKTGVCNFRIYCSEIQNRFLAKEDIFEYAWESLIWAEIEDLGCAYQQYPQENQPK